MICMFDGSRQHIAQAIWLSRSSGKNSARTTRMLDSNQSSHSRIDDLDSNANEDSLFQKQASGFLLLELLFSRSRVIRDPTTGVISVYTHNPGPDPVNSPFFGPFRSPGPGLGRRK